MEEEVTQVALTPVGSASLTSARIVGDIQLLQREHQGLSSEVFSGQSLKTGGKCALKLLRAELKAGAVVRGRYMHEAQRVATLALREVADVFAFGTAANGRAYAVSEWLGGSSLRTLIAQHAPWPQRSSLALTRALCESLAPLHVHGFAHRRLHPGNVMVTQWTEDAPPQIKLLDCGVWHVHPALDVEGIERTNEDALALAPEIAAGESGDLRSDVYAIALMLYRMLTGRPPFSGADFAQVLEQQRSQPPDPPSRYGTVPAAVEDTIMRGLEKDPQRRIPSVEALLSAIDPLWNTSRHHAVSRPRMRSLTTGEWHAEEATEIRDAQLGSPGTNLDAIEKAAWPNKRKLVFAAVTLGVLVLLIILIAR